MTDDLNQGEVPSTTDREATMRRLLDAGFPVDRYSYLEEPLLTTSEVALILRTTSRTVRTWADEGKIQALRSLGGRRLFPASAILVALDSMVEQPGSDNIALRRGNRIRRSDAS